MKVYKKYPAILILIMLLVSCDIDYNINYTLPESESMIVVTGFINKTDGLRVAVQSSGSIYQNSYNNALKNLRIRLFENNRVVADSILPDNSIYFIYRGFDIQLASQYRIEIDDDRHTSVSSLEQQIPHVIEIDSISAKSEKLSCYFSDPKEEQNYYALKIYKFIGGDTIYEYPSDSVAFNMSFLSNDQSFSSKEAEITVNFNTSVFLEDGIFNLDSAEIQLLSISKDFYLFLKSYRDNVLSNDDSNLAAIVPVYSNIRNGAGIFGAYSYSSRKIKFSD